VLKVDDQAIAKILGDMPLKAGDHLGTGVLIGPYHLAQILRVESGGEDCGVYQVTKQHGELAALSLWSMGCRWCSAGKPCLVGLWSNAPNPDQNLPVLIDRQVLGVHQVFLECFQSVVSELQSYFEDAIGEAFLLLKEH